MSATVNAFPAVHTFNSPRSWVLAIIIVLHLGFFVALTSGLSRSISIFPSPQTQAFVVDQKPPTPPPQRRIVDVVQREIYVPVVADPSPIPETDDDTAPRIVTHEQPQEATPAVSEPVVRLPVEVAPDIDPRRGLSEPLYPSAVIRDGIEGTVLLSVQVLENGRVGQVRLDQSSGDRRLDDSALREARRWRLKPGTRDGVAVVLWKQIPVTFRLQDRR